MKAGNSTIIAISFVLTWLAILYAGADHPPPAGFFIWLIPLVCICGLVVFLRISSYASWSTARRPGRFALAMRDGLLAGLVVGMVTLITPNSGEPSIAPPPFASVLTWFVVLMAVGCLNALLLYGLASTITNFQQAIPVNTHDVQNRQIELL
jgi:hypothetical protein